MGHILSLFTYLLTTSVSGWVPRYPSYYPAGTRVINYPDTAALVISILHFTIHNSHQQSNLLNPENNSCNYFFLLYFHFAALFAQNLCTNISMELNTGF